MADIDWREREDRLVDLAKREVVHFLEKEQGKKFYGFGFACNAGYGEVLLYTNTHLVLRETAERYKSTGGARYADKTLEELEDRLRWSMGDWAFDGFNALSDDWQRGWEDWQHYFQQLLDSLLNDDKEDEYYVLREEFLNMCCRALIRLENQPEFVAMPKEADFRTICVDHDEADSDGEARLSRIRRDTIA